MVTLLTNDDERNFGRNGLAREFLDVTSDTAALPADGGTNSMADVLRTRWAQAWPKGLAIPNSSIPNRDPLAFVPEEGMAGRQGLAAELLQLAHVPAQFEPLVARPPLEVWQEPVD